MRGNGRRYEDVESGGILYRLTRSFMNHPLRILLSKVGLPVGLIFAGFAGVNYWLLTDIDGTYSGTASDLGRVQLIVEKQGNDVFGKMLLPTEQFNVEQGTMRDGKVELALSPVDQPNSTSINNKLIFVGDLSGESLTGILTRGSNEYNVRLRRSAITVMFQRLVAWR